MFSTKMLFIAFAVSCTSLAVATAIPQYISMDLVSRQTATDGILSIVTSSLALVTGLLTAAGSLGVLGTTGQTLIAGQVDSILAAASTSLLAAGPNSLASGDLSPVVSESVQLIVELVTVILDLGLQNTTALDMSTDTALSGWVTALNKTSPGIAPVIGKRVQNSKINWTKFTKAFHKTEAVLQG